MSLIRQGAACSDLPADLPAETMQTFWLPYCGIFFICVTQTGENMLGWAWFYPLGIEK